MNSRGVLLCTAAAVLFGASAPAASRLADDMSAFTLAGLLYLGAAIAVMPIVVRDPPSAPTLRRGGSRLAVAVVVGGAIAPVLLAAGLTRTSAASASLLLNLELGFTVVLAGLLFGEHLGRRVVTGTLAVVAGGVVLAWSASTDLRIGALLIAGACACWAIDNCVTAALDELAPSHITFVKGLIAGSVNLVIGIAVTGASTGAAASVAWALVVGAIGYGVSITLWVGGARELGAARGQLVFATAPFIGAVMAWTLFDDQPTIRELAALAVAAAGVSLVLGSDHEHEHHHDEAEHDHEHRHDDVHHVHPHKVAVQGRHRHRHHHDPVVHHHPHVPDLHHRHGHADIGTPT